MGSLPGMRTSPERGNGNPLQHSCMGNSMDRGAWRTTVHGVAKESDTTEHTHSSNRQNNIKISCFPNSEEYGHHLFQISIALEFPKNILHYHYVCVVHISFLKKELYFGAPSPHFVKYPIYRSLALPVPATSMFFVCAIE